jgi:hypothetical protein
MPEIFTIGFSEDAFASAVAGELATPGITPLAAHQDDGASAHQGSAVSRGAWPARYETLENLASGGARFGTPNFASRPGPGTPWTTRS